MSGFSAQWLALREPADRAARNAPLAARLSDLMAAYDPIRITDLGAGTGSNLRASAELFGPRQDWTLLDHDAGLLKAARADLSAWAEQAEEEGDWLVLHKGGRRIRVACRTGDLAAQPELVRAASPHLVTASAFFDLASAAWIARFADEVAQAGGGLLHRAHLRRGGRLGAAASTRCGDRHGVPRPSGPRQGLWTRGGQWRQRGAGGRFPARRLCGGTGAEPVATLARRSASPRPRRRHRPGGGGDRRDFTG